MSDEELRSAVEQAFARNPDLNERLKNATHVRDTVAVLKEAGIETTQAQLVKAEARRLAEVDDAELEAAEIRVRYTTDTLDGCLTWVLWCCP